MKGLPVLKKSTKLQNIGLFLNGTTKPVEFERVSLLYAENGRGKSTLAGVLRSCALGDGVRLQAKKTLDSAAAPEASLLFEFAGKNRVVEYINGNWNDRVPQLLVFDAEFVEQNVYSGYEVRAEQRQALLEFVLGDQAVKLKQQIGGLTKTIADATARRSDAEKRIAAFSQQMPLAQFIALVPVLDATHQADTLRKRVEAVKNAAALVQRQLPAAIPSLAFDATGFFGILSRVLADVEKNAEAVVREHFLKHPAPVGIEHWISIGQAYANTEDCPFCGQKLEGLALIEAYQSYFNQSYADLKKQVATLRQQAETGLADPKIDGLASLVATNTARVEAWKDQIDIVPPPLPLEQLRELIAAVRATAVDLAIQKQSQPLESFGTATDKAAIAQPLEQIDAAVAKYNQLLVGTVAAIEAFKKKLSTEDIAALQAKIRSLEIAIARQHADAIKAVGDHQTAEAERKKLDDDKTKTRVQLDCLMAATLTQYQARINTLLGKFGADFTIEQMKPNYQGTGEPRTEYAFRLRQQHVPLGSRKDVGAHFGSTLSEGDKRTLALAFFLAKIESDPVSLAEIILVLDDPVSSLDRNRRAQTVDVLAVIAAQSAQMIVLSHDAYFVREMREKLVKAKPPIFPRIGGIARVQNDYSAFSSCDIDDICASDYYRHHRQLSEYVAGVYPGNIRDVAKAVRLFLEGYYHRRFPGLLPTGCTFGGAILAISQAPVGSPISHLQPRVNEMSEVNAYAARFHHDTNPGLADTAPVADGELKPYVVRALALVYQG